MGEGCAGDVLIECFVHPFHHESNEVIPFYRGKVGRVPLGLDHIVLLLLLGCSKGVLGACWVCRGVLGCARFSLG